MALHFNLITPEKTLLSVQAAMVTAPGVEGEFGVLPGHAPFVSTLKPGVVMVEEEGGAVMHVAVTDGVAEVTPEHCTILSETARLLLSDENPEEVLTAFIAAAV